MKLSMTPQPKNGLPLALIAAVTAVLLIGVSFAGLAQSASAKPTPGKKIVALTPFAANTMGTLGVAPKAVGEVLNTSDNVSSFVPLIDRGIRSNKIGQLALTHPNGPNLEQLAKTRAKLVFSSPQWAKGTPAMRSLGMKVQSYDPKNLGQVYANYKRIARTIGKSKQANRRVKAMKRQVRNALPPRSASRKKVMLILGVGRTPFTFLPNSWGGHIVQKAGGNLLTGGVSDKSGFARISDEVVIAEDPDVIIAVPHAVKNDIEGLVEYMENNPAWSSTKAVTSGNLYISQDNSLLQAGVNPGQVIRKVRKQFLSK